jgi:hypothetical protein
MAKKYYIVIISIVWFATMIDVDATPHLKWKGDIRLRNQIEDTKNEGKNRRTRQRIRFRLNGESSVSDQTDVKFGFATGGTDARSTNQSLKNSFQTPDIRLNYAFVRHALTDQLTLLGGKMKNPLWRPSDLLWDTDINPDGAAIRYGSKAGQLDVFMSGGIFIVDEIESGADPVLFAIQPGIKTEINDQISAQGAMGVYFTQNLLTQDLIPIVFSGQIDIQNQWGVPLIRPFGELVINTKESHSNKGAIAGIKLGDKKVKGFGTWQTRVSYRYLQSNAWLDILPDSDSYGGQTNVKGVEFDIKVGVSNAVTVGVDLYRMNKITGEDQRQWLAQLDLNVKF